MNSGAATIITPAALNRAFVFSAVTRFARAKLAKPSSIFEEMEHEADLAALLGLPRGDWNNALQQLAAYAPQLPGPFGQLLRDYRLQLHEWFIVALCGETESTHLLNLALSELQEPMASARPGVHLVAAMSQALFDAALSPLTIGNHPLVRAGVLEVSGEGPAPTRQLSVPPELWALLCGDRTPWRTVRPLPPCATMISESLRNELSVIADQVRRGGARVILFRGNTPAGLAAASLLAEQLDLAPMEIEQEAWQQLPAMATACHYASWLPVMAFHLGPGDTYRPSREHLYQTPLVIAAGHDGSVEAEGLIELSIPALTREERLQAWREALPTTFSDELADLALIDGAAIRTLADRMRIHSALHDQPPSPHHLRSARVQFGSAKLRLLAHPVNRHVEAEGLILPTEIQLQFDRLVQRCQRREQLWQGLGASLADATPGVRALFAGESGSGKTLAASRLATVLGAPLFRLDLAAVMNKYVGESEKNLGRLLDEAAAIDAILLMDEADALFGRRSEGKETGERYANMLTNFLLTRIEIHPGIVVLTSNSRTRIDAAFTRRFDAVIEFPPPGVEERYRLWRSHLGSRAPSDQVCRLLASFSDLAGGHIRNVVLNAAAAHRSAAPSISVLALMEALRAEYQKLGRTVPPQLEHLTE